MKTILVYDRFLDLDHLSGEGESPLYTALKHNRKDIAKYLLINRADPTLGKPISALQQGCSKDADIRKYMATNTDMLEEERGPLVIGQRDKQLRAETEQRALRASSSLDSAISAMAISAATSTTKSAKVVTKKSVSGSGNAVGKTSTSSSSTMVTGLKHCFHCEKKETTRNEFMLCGKCKVASYCSQACQKLDWKASHKLVCTSK